MGATSLAAVSRDECHVARGLSEGRRWRARTATGTWPPSPPGTFTPPSAAVPRAPAGRRHVRLACRKPALFVSVLFLFPLHSGSGWKLIVSFFKILYPKKCQDVLLLEFQIGEGHLFIPAGHSYFSLNVRVRLGEGRVGHGQLAWSLREGGFACGDWRG